MEMKKSRKDAMLIQSYDGTRSPAHSSGMRFGSDVSVPLDDGSGLRSSLYSGPQSKARVSGSQLWKAGESILSGGGSQYSSFHGHDTTTKVRIRGKHNEVSTK